MTFPLPIVSVQLAASVFLLLLLIFVFKQTQSLRLFPVRVFVTEWGHVVAVISLAIAVSADRSVFLGQLATTLAGLATLGFLTPYFRAQFAVANVRAAIEPAFGPLTGDPVRFWRLFALPRLRSPRFRKLDFAGPGGPLHVDFSPGPSGRHSPLIVAVHGGGWAGGVSAEGADWAEWARSQGWARASVHYRLVPYATWPAQREDVLAAIDYLQSHSNELGVDPDCLVLLGRSAGGQIAASIASDGTLDYLRGCISYYAPYDLHYAFEHSRDDDGLRSRCLIRDYLGGNPDAVPAQYDEASPSVTIRPEAPPFLLFHGGNDELVNIAQTRRFADCLAAANVPHAVVEFPWATHAFDYNLRGPAGQLTAACLATFLDSVRQPRHIDSNAAP
ncbi:MAG: alpha/beta hydrolase [Chthoniobacterales bacterium]